ncbi:MAG: septum formation inhibitor Maf [Gammaproteobacteria bacterium]|nr:septum formation inhibitor Maf [Gammaproteobacteria bacterium]
MPDRTLVLASSSSFRKMLMERLLLPFETVNPNIDESALIGEEPANLVERLSIEKAKTVGLVYTNALVIGSDQVALHDGKIVGKPGTHEKAVEQLREASGSKVQLYTGLALMNTITKKIQSQVIPFAVHFRSLSEEVIEAYLHKEKPYNCAGSLRAEGLGIALLERFDGDDPSALIGLPLIALVTMLEKEKYPLFR